jgi:glycosyltransferase involved in cell wall biosynthesis
MNVDEALATTSIIIPVKNDMRLARCLATVDEDVEIVLALNAASDEIRELARSHPRRPTIVEIDDANIGAAYNAGVSVASGRFLLFMDSDCTFEPGTIRRMASLVIDHPVVKGLCSFTAAHGWLSDVIRRAREFQTSDHCNAYSPPLIYDVEIIEKMGGYHYSDFIHSQQDREFDFRLQLTGVPVYLDLDCVIYHAAQTGAADLRSGHKYGIGEGIGRELGIFVTPSPLWRAVDDIRSLGQVWRAKGFGPAVYRAIWLTAYNLGTARQALFDPYRVRDKYPPEARRVRSRTGVSVHSTRLSESYQNALRRSHAQQGRVITKVG